MIKCGDWPIAVCSWSLGQDVAGVAASMKELGIDHVHLAVGPGLGKDGAAYMKAVQEQDWRISSTMIGFPGEDYSSLESIRRTGGIAPDDAWEENRSIFIGAKELTRELHVKYLSMHAGFIDPKDAAYRAKFFERIRELADRAAEDGVELLLETGQESAWELREFLEELNHPNLGVNFDPANMILYDKGEPIQAVGVLGPWIRHLHIKDAFLTKKPGTWGEEVPWGEGHVGGDSFLHALKETGFQGVVAIEREAGTDRMGDIRKAVERLTAFPG